MAFKTIYSKPINRRKVSRPRGHAPRKRIYANGGAR